MKRYEFRLRISAEQYVEYYRGTAQHVMVRCTTGQTLQFPAFLLRRFVTAEGVHGAFVLVCDENRKCVRLERIAPDGN